MKPWARGLEARLVNLRWYDILSRDSVIAQLSDDSTHLVQSGRVNFTRGSFTPWGYPVGKMQCSGVLRDWEAP